MNSQTPLVDIRDQQFVLFEMLKTDSIFAHNKYRMLDKAMCEETIHLASRIAMEKWYPVNSQAEEEGARYNPDMQEVTLPRFLHDPYKEMTTAGFISQSERDDPGGMPMNVSVAYKEHFCSANPALSFLWLLTGSAAGLIRRFGTPEQKNLYLDKMLSGDWSGTMCLTEPDAGSDVGRVRTIAKEMPDGTYRITGQKIFISYGEHDLAENIINLVLARTENAPPGTKGLSLFIVPKFLVGTDGMPGERNGVYCRGIEKKIGFHASPTCILSFGDDAPCTGYLLSSQGQGMKIMFQMMNEERIFCGLQGLACSSAAYNHARTYAGERLQGSHYLRILDPDAPAVPISQHPDVMRMLQWMKAYVEGMRMFTYYLAWNIDVSENHDGTDADEARALVSLLTPLCKAGNSDMVWLISAEAIQVFGGYGLCRDFPVEGIARSGKILSIVEGANGIQSIDCIVKKILFDQDQYRYGIFRKRILEAVVNAGECVDADCVDIVSEGMSAMDGVIGNLKECMNSGKMDAVLTAATPVQQALFLLSMAWMHLWSLTIAIPEFLRLADGVNEEDLDSLIRENRDVSFYHEKIECSKSFIRSEFPKYFGRIRSVRGHLQ